MIACVAFLALVIGAGAMTLHGCGDDGGAPSATPTPAPLGALAGTYDVSGVASTGRGGVDEPIGVVGEEHDGVVGIRIDIDTLDAIVVTAAPAADGSLALDGDRILGVDAFLSTTGTAALVADAGERRIAGTLTDTGGSDPSVSFVMVRPAAGTPTTFSGSYVFSFDPSPSGCGLPPCCLCQSFNAPDTSGSF